MRRPTYDRKVIELLATFPAGAAGAALLLLRVSAALVILIAAMTCGLHPMWGWVGMGLVGAALVLGFLARIGAALVVLVAGLVAATASGSLSWLFALHALDGVALVLLGPGAYSIDARMFGRRVITFES